MSEQTERITDERDTEARLLSIIGMNYTILRAGDRRIADHSKAAQIIAAEIDALTRECDEARKSLLVEREAYSKRAAEQIADGAVKLMAEELAEARAERDAASEQRKLDRITIAAQADVIDERNAQLAEARAEVERLRPAAEAWEAQAQTFRAYDDAVRARAAKEVSE